MNHRGLWPLSFHTEVNVDYLPWIIELLVGGLAVNGIIEIWNKGSIFEQKRTELLDSYTACEEGTWVARWYELLLCPFCLSFWVTLILCLVAGIGVLFDWPLHMVNWFFAMMRVANIVHDAMRPQKKEDVIVQNWQPQPPSPIGQPPMLDKRSWGEMMKDAQAEMLKERNQEGTQLQNEPGQATCSTGQTEVSSSSEVTGEYSYSGPEEAETTEEP